MLAKQQLVGVIVMREGEEVGEGRKGDAVARTLMREGFVCGHAYT